MRYIALIHLTPRENIRSILAYGVNPAFARTRRRATYWCDPASLARAIDHACRRQGVLADELACVCAIVPAAWIKPAGATWIFRVDRVVWPDAIYDAVCIYADGNGYVVGDPL